MKNSSALAVFWRRKGIVIAVFLAFAIGTAVISKTLPKVYETNATLFITLQDDQQSFDSVQASQALARSYADIIDSPNIAQLVVDQIGGDKTTVGNACSFEPVQETQLLDITCEDKSPERAKEIADTYATVFIEFARTRLQDTQATISLADQAPLSESPARPKPTLYTLVAAMLGLALGLGLAFLRDRLDHRLRTSEDVETRFDVPVLARIPRRGRSDTSVTAFREANRVLRTNLQFAGQTGKPLRALAITSGRAGEGKTTTVSQLAVASAEVGQRVIVVEADFRRPALQRELLPDREEPLRPGLTNYLVEAASLEDVIFPTGRPNIDIVPAGPLPPSPSALLESRRGRDAVSELLGEADLVLIDCPPLSIGADASVIAGWVDGVIVVVDLGGSTDDTVRNALRQLDAVQARTLGLVLNRDRSVEPSSYDYYLTPTGEKARETASTRGR